MLRSMILHTFFVYSGLFSELFFVLCLLFFYIIGKRHIFVPYTHILDHMKKLIASCLLSFGMVPHCLNAQPLFLCSPTIGDDYGVCTHITRPSLDFKIRNRELDLTHEIGIEWVRSDLDFGNYFGSLEEEDPRIFDAVLQSCESHDTQLLGILTWMGKWPWLDEQYDAYVKKLAQHYDGRIRYWEALNEVNLFPKRENLEENYLYTLQTTYETLKSINGDNQVLLSGLAEVTNEFLSHISSMGAHKFFDIMNFHSYLAPEALVPSFHRIDSVMQRDGWCKPVWLTECGMHTAETGNSSLGFFDDLLPEALHLLGITENKVCVGVLSDTKQGYHALTEEETDLYLRPYCKQIREISFPELAEVCTKNLPVLMASKDEYFPANQFSILVDYVRRGGTIILCGGMPFYYDAHNEEGTFYNRKEIGTSLYRQLHMSPQNAWNANQTGEKLSETPDVVRLCKNAKFSYQWNFSTQSPARYLSGSNLQPGDSLISLITAGTENCQGTVAGIYKLNSDLKGNIIFQTRMYSMLLPNREAEQARRVARIYLLAFAHGISKVFWYNLRSQENDMKYSEDCFGLIHADFSEKPSMQAYRTLVQMCPPGSTRPRLEIESNLYKCMWEKPDGSDITALWSPERTISYPLKKFRGKAIDHLGRPIIPSKKSIRVGGGIVFLVNESEKENKNEIKK